MKTHFWHTQHDRKVVALQTFIGHQQNSKEHNTRIYILLLTIVALDDLM